jgi:hypothetical protein
LLWKATRAPQWQPGQSGNPKGQPIGSRNKLNEKFILALHDDFAKHGPAVIAEVRETRPEVYLERIPVMFEHSRHGERIFCILAG